MQESGNIKGNQINADDIWGFKPMQDTSVPWNAPYPLAFQARHEALLLRARESGIRTLLTGEGGDELMIPGIGYQMDLLRGLRLPRLRQELSYVDQRSRRYFWREAVRLHLSRIRQNLPGAVTRIYRGLRTGAFEPWLEEEALRQSGALDFNPLELDGLKSRSLYRQSQYIGPIAVARTPFLGYITEIDARYQVEARHPFLDRRVVDFLTKVPPSIKMSNGYGKYLLRQAMAGTMPDEVRLRRSKTDFGDITAAGFKNEEARLRPLLESGFLVRAGWLKRPEVKTLFDRVLLLS